MKKPKVGDWIKILKMDGEPNYTGRIGKIDHIDDIDQLHGSWGGLAVNLEVDEIQIVRDPTIK